MASAHDKRIAREAKEKQKTIVTHLDGDIKAARDIVEKLRIDLRRLEPIHALEWSRSTFEAAAKLHVWTQARQALTKRGTHTTLESVREYALREALRGAAFSSRSASATAELAARGITSAWAQLYRLLGGDLTICEPISKPKKP